MNEILTLPAATAFKLFAAFVALNKQQVTAVIHAIGMRIGRFTALMTF
jgi:hypothetical protein